MKPNDITYKIISAIYNVYNSLGPGLLESVYEEALCYEMEKIGLSVERQKEVTLYYDDIQLHTKLRLDILVENEVIVEVKSVEELANVHYLQIDTYMRLSNIKLGIIVNFNTDDIAHSFHRRINSFSPKYKL